MKSNMSSVIICALLSFQVSSCGKDEAKRTFSFGASIEKNDDPPTGQEPSVSSASIPETAGEIDALANFGSLLPIESLLLSAPTRGLVPFVLNATDVEKVMTRIFGAAMVQSVRAANKSTEGRIFNSYQLDGFSDYTLTKKFNQFTLRTQGEVQVQPHVHRRLSAVTKDYFWAVRSYLDVICKASMSSKSGKYFDAGFLPEDLPASEQDVNRTMTLFFGYKPPDGKTHRGAKLYSDLITAEWSKADAAQKLNLRVLLCISVGSDYRTVTR